MSKARGKAQQAADAREPGAILRAARERMGVEASEVASALHLDEGVILAIEESRLDDLPAHAYAQGYVRRYARLLRLDADALATRFNEISRDRAAPPAPQPWSHPATFDDQPPRRAGWRYTLVVVGLLAASGMLLWIAWRFVDLPVLIADRFGDSAPAVETEAGPTPAAPVGPQQQEEAEVPPVSLGADSAGAESDVATDADQLLVGAPSEPPDAVVDDAAPLAGDEAATGVDELTMRFRAESWVTVEDGAGAQLFADLGNPGSSVTVTGTAPFAIVLGYAPGVDLTFNGDAVTLEPHTRDNVARLVLAN